MEGLVACTRASIVGTAARTRHFLCCLRSSACCLLPACRGLLQAACGFPPAAFALGCLRCWCVLQREEHIVSSRLFGVVCGQGTVASCCEMKSGLEWRSLTCFGSRGTRNAVAPPLGRLDFGSQISGPKSSPQSGAACQAPHYEVQGTRCQNTGCIWAQDAVLEIRRPGGPAGWVKMRAPGMIRTPCQAKARVTVRIVSPTQAHLLFVLSCARRASPLSIAALS